MKEVSMDNKKSIIFLILIVIIVIITLILVINKNEVNKVSDGEKFAKSYTELTSDNVFVYRNSEEIINILSHGTGAVLLGFPSCPWCQRYVVYLNEVAKELDIDKIYYYDIYEDRKNNTDTYKKIIEILGDNVRYDNEGNKRIYVPYLVGVNEGKIVGFNDETSYDTKGFETPEEYYKENDSSILKESIKEILTLSNPNICSSCNK